MTSFYTKTALKKIKKDDLIQMFLDQQAKIYDMKMEAEEMNQKGWLEIAKREEEHKKLKEENEKLKEDLEEKEEEVSLINSEEMENEEKIALLEVENEKLKEENKEHEETIAQQDELLDELTEDLDKDDDIKTQLTELRREVKMWENAVDL